jgi:hypothetical protein
VLREGYFQRGSVRYEETLSARSIVDALTLEQATAHAVTNGVWLLATVASPSNGLHDAAHESAWEDPKVLAWIGRKGFAVQVDIHSALPVVDALEVRALPTVIAFWAGKEKERIVGLRNGRLAEWLGALSETGTPDIALRHSAAKMRLDEKQYGDATKAYAWLWNNMLPADSSWKGVRLSSMLKEIGTLVGIDPLARATFCDIRDATADAAVAFGLRGSPAPRIDWLALNEALGEDDRTIEWFDAVNGNPDAATLIEDAAAMLLEPLKAHRRWADIGRLFPDPLTRLREISAFLGLARSFGSAVLDREHSAGVRSAALNTVRAEAALIYGSLVAAGRTDEAKLIYREAIRLDPSEEMRSALQNAPVPNN